MIKFDNGGLMTETEMNSDKGVRVCFIKEPDLRRNIMSRQM